MSENGKRRGEWEPKKEGFILCAILPLCLQHLQEWASTCSLWTPPMQVGNVSSQMELEPATRTKKQKLNECEKDGFLIKSENEKAGFVK